MLNVVEFEVDFDLVLEDLDVVDSVEFAVFGFVALGFVELAVDDFEQSAVVLAAVVHR